jgi:hypothetical protein
VPGPASRVKGTKCKRTCATATLSWRSEDERGPRQRPDRFWPGRDWWAGTIPTGAHRWPRSSRPPSRAASGSTFPETLPDHEERYLARQGYLILEFFLHVSKKAQKERFLERLDRPEKNWKFSLADAQEREHWNAYARAYEDMIRVTAAPHAPWYVVPADKKWFTRLVVAAAADESLDRLKLAYPKVDEAKK